MHKRTPAVNVWVNFAAAYPLRAVRGRYVAGGINLAARIPARLHLWAVTTTGHWVGWITYEHRSMNGVTGWVVTAALEERFDQPAHRDRGNGKTSSN